MLVILVGLVIGLGIWLVLGFGICVLSYFLLNVIYSFGFKCVFYFDVFCIVTGFELRVLFGVFVVDLVVSCYLFLVMFLLAMFLGLGKCLHEFVHVNVMGVGKMRLVFKCYN